ncbi:MAG: radical SAM protein [Nitrososphaeria archaeon]
MIVFRADAEAVWKDSEVRRRLSWYRRVLDNESLAKYIICKRVPSEDPKDLNENSLWRLHDRLREEFLRLMNEVEGGRDVVGLGMVEPNFLDVKIALAERIVERCHFCEWRCSVNRRAGEKGFCRVGYDPKVATWFHHFGEEAPLIGVGGSGTIFFAGCNFGPCVYCQNWDISSDPDNGASVTPRTLALIAKKLKEGDAANINYVGGEPTPNLHAILSSLKVLDVSVPLLWNSNMYCSMESMKILSDVIDIWLPDFKYGNDSCAEQLSKVEHYFEVVTRNHKIAHDNGSMIVRHLVLPGHLGCCTKNVLEWISKNLPNALVNIMEQYHPDYLVQRYPDMYKGISRRVSREEMDEAYSYADGLGLVYKPVS